MFTHLIWGPVWNTHTHTHTCGSELSTAPRQSRCPSHSGPSASLPRLTYWIFRIWCLGCWVGWTLGGFADVWFVLRGFAGMKVTVGKLLFGLVCPVLYQSLLDSRRQMGGGVKVPYSLKRARNKKTNGRLKNHSHYYVKKAWWINTNWRLIRLLNQWNTVRLKFDYNWTEKNKNLKW